LDPTRPPPAAVDGALHVPWTCPAGHPRPLVRAADRLTCPECRAAFPIVDGIPRFVADEGYGASFGLEWTEHPRTQLDSVSGLTQTADRFFESTGWTAEELAGRQVLEVGCGAGRFTEVVLGTGAKLTSVDLSRAVEANWANHRNHPGLQLAQADLFRLPLPEGAFDFVFCLGVLQHTPDPAAGFHTLLRYVRPGGHLCVDVYPRTLASYLQWKVLLRPLTTRLPPRTLYRAVRTLAPLLMKVSVPLSRVPRVGRVLQRTVPVADYSARLDLPRDQLDEWAVLDTFDWLSPAYDRPQMRKALERWVARAGLEDAKVFRPGIYVVRGRRPAE
jgi:SAM-dependent methyltransferase